MASKSPEKKAILSHVVIETTRRCNLKCIHCKVSPENNEGNYQASEMSLDVFEKLIPTLRAYRPVVQLSGHGETLLHPKFMHILEQTAAAGCEVTFQTNGTLLTPRKIEEIIRLGVSSIAFSVDAASAELFEKIRRGASFERIIGNIAAVAEARERLGRRVRLGIEFVAMRMNIHELPDLVRLAARLGVANIQVAHLWEYNLTRGQAITEDPLILPWIDLAEREARSRGIHLRLPSNIPRRAGTAAAISESKEDRAEGSCQPQKHGKDGSARKGALAGLRKTCTEPWDSLLVRPNGEVIPCCMIREPYGNLTIQSFEEIWSNAKYRKLRSALLSDKPFDLCINCSFYGWETVPTRLSVSFFGRAWNVMIRRLISAPAETTSFSDGQLLWLLWRLAAPNDLAAFNCIRQGKSSVALSCLELLYAGCELAPEEFVGRLYRRVLGREPDPEGFAGHLQSLRNGGRSPLNLVETFLSSEEFLQKLPPL